MNRTCSDSLTFQRFALRDKTYFSLEASYSAYVAKVLPSAVKFRVIL